MLDHLPRTGWPFGCGRARVRQLISRRSPSTTLERGDEYNARGNVREGGIQLERLVRHAFEQLLGRPNSLQMQQLGDEMWREDREINDVTDDDDSRNREEGRT